MNTKKNLVNPYLFLLARRILDYEFVGLNSPPSNLQLASFIYDRHKGRGFENTKFTDESKLRDSIAFSKAERIRKFVLPVEDFMISSEMLDHLISEFTFFMRNYTWNKFLETFSMGPYAIQGKSHVGVLLERKRGIHPDVIYKSLIESGNPFLNHINFKNDNFTKEDYAQYLAYANATLVRLHTNYFAEDWINKPLFFFRKMKLIARTANENEIILLEHHASKYYSNTAPFLKNLKSWHKVNKDIYFYFLNSERLIYGGYAFIPLHEYAYNKLLKGEIQKNNITEEDVLLSHSDLSSKYILFEIIFSDKFGHAVLKYYGKVFKYFLNEYATLFSYNKISITAFASTDYEINFLKEQGFTRTGKVLYDDYGQMISIVYELPWTKPNPSIKRLSDYWSEEY